MKKKNNDIENNYYIIIFLIIILILWVMRIELPNNKTCNFDNNYKFIPEEYYRPTSITEIQNIIINANNNNKKIRIRGGKHLWNDMGVSKDILIDMENFNKIIDLKDDFVTVQTGVNIGDLLKELEKYGKTLQDCPTAYKTSVGGLINTGCHGHGIQCGSCSSLVESLTLINGSGIIININKTDYRFSAASMSLGCLGVIIDVTFRIVDDYNIQYKTINTFNNSYKNEYINLQQNIDNNIDNNDYLLLTLDVYNPKKYGLNIGKEEKKIKNSINFNNINLPIVLQPINSNIYDIIVYYIFLFLHKLLGIVGCNINKEYFTNKLTEILINNNDLLYERTDFFKFGAYIVSAPTTDIEIFISSQDVENAIKDILIIINENKSYCNPIPLCIRFKKSDDNILLSPFKHKYNAGIGFGNWKHEKDCYEINKKISLMLMNKYNGRPHWGKVIFLNHELMKYLYGDSYTTFINIKKQFDPNNIFTNEYISRIL